MSQSLTYHCDVCGAVKKESNHWFHAVAFPHVFAIADWDKAEHQINLVPEQTDSAVKLDLCGLECAHKAMDRALTEGR